MPDDDSQLDLRLRSFLDEIKAQPLPHQLADFKPATVRSGRKVLNVLAGSVAAAVIAASVTVFAIELNGHHGAALLFQVAHLRQRAVPSPHPGGTSSQLRTAASGHCRPTAGRAAH